MKNVSAISIVLLVSTLLFPSYSLAITPELVIKELEEYSLITSEYDQYLKLFFESAKKTVIFPITST